MSGAVVRKGQASTEVAVRGAGPQGGVGQVWHPEVLDGPLSQRSLMRLDSAMRLADTSTGWCFSVYIGDLEYPFREHAKGLHAQLDDPDRSVLLAISPNQRALEIVTGASARTVIVDRDCRLAALSMASAFAGGDLGGGIVSGLAQLAERAVKAAPSSSR